MRLRSASTSGPNVMGDLPGVVAEAHAAIEAGRSEPKGAAVFSGSERLPETDVMPLIGAFSDRLFESEVLPAAVEHQQAHRRVRVGTIEHHAGADLDTAAQGDGIRRIPFCSGEGMQNVAFRADQPDIDGIAGDALRRHRQHLL